ncbi:hypothetical protein [Zhongshania sp. BJYM1]|jgi:hypothetical protein|uniref:hypothetical protein n=1 Tax=Zhongshania aquatica TaxID=2965069 RepID=UPI0022B5D56C|nr:hypothetical protein [Marortus sp. BJYM1]
MKLMSLFIALIMLAGCSNRSLYEGVQASNRNDCAKLQSPQYDECMENANRSYNDYERERKESLGH